MQEFVKGKFQINKLEYLREIVEQKLNENFIHTIAYLAALHTNNKNQFYGKLDSSCQCRRKIFQESLLLCCLLAKIIMEMLKTN